jgi:tryptophanyl-tRNA synthetase
LISSYSHLVKFGCFTLIDERGKALVERLERLTGKPAHPLLRRGIFFAHRDLEAILDRHERGLPFYLYTGRGPSSGSLHLGHLVPFMFTKYLQEVFNVPLVIQVSSFRDWVGFIDDGGFQMSDDEKMIMKGLSMAEVEGYSFENIKDILSVGLDPSRTFIFTNTAYIRQCPPFQENVLKLLTSVNVNRVKKIFGVCDEHPSGMVYFPAVEAAPCICSSFPHIFGKRTDIPCLVPAAVDQVSGMGLVIIGQHLTDIVCRIPSSG